ncbi:MAG TPA: thiol:disulfide interchange protein DsbA/DsbL [Burkholderiaceae bacterium]|nr:thiol:disulfide interchange protein DsbA/DsbL [Burkholderiaceae bacterium]
MSSSFSRRDFLMVLGATPLVWAARVARAQVAPAPREGLDYLVVLNPQPTEPPGKIEVLDFFWYGCPHCYAFLPDLEAWRKRQPADVAFHHVPVDFGVPGRDAHSKIFYALQALNRVDDMHVKVFDAFHQRHLRLLDRDEIADFMAASGIPREKWLAAYDSFTVASLVNRAHQTVQAYGIDGTPTLACDGRFLTSPSIVQSHTNTGALAVLDYLIERTRRERAHKAP